MTRASQCPFSLRAGHPIYLRIQLTHLCKEFTQTYPKNKHYISITATVLVQKIFAVYCEDRANPMKMACERNSELIDFKIVVQTTTNSQYYFKKDNEEINNNSFVVYTFPPSRAVGML
jgi:hypothetical protein